MNFTVVTFKRQANLMRLYSKCGFEEFTTWYILKFTPRIDIKNYTDLDRKMIELTTTKEKPKLLIHSCCGPCSSYIIDYLKNYFEITIYYYNPNIYPKEEYDKRLLTQKQIADILLLKQGQIPPVIEGIYDYSLFENWTKTTLEKEKGNRCYQCYYMRIEEAANYAKKHNFDYYTTTLSISPHKNADWINEIGFLASKKYQINFLYSNFKLKEGYKKSIELSKKYALYRQNYCGCKHSMENE